jgi:hypothetical protein
MNQRRVLKNATRAMLFRYKSERFPDDLCDYLLLKSDYSMVSTPASHTPFYEMLSPKSITPFTAVKKFPLCGEKVQISDTNNRLFPSFVAVCRYTTPPPPKFRFENKTEICRVT